jgi:hypothetical protein
MNRRTLIAAYVFVVVLATIIGLILSGFIVDFITRPQFPFPIPPEYLPGVLAAITIKTVLSMVNVALILLMLVIYVDLYRKLKSNFTAGLVLLILVLLMNAGSSNPLLFLRFDFPIVGGGPFFILPDLFSTIALTILFYLSLE